jgi:ribonuclease Z
MKPTFHHRPVNGPFEDPCIYARFLWERRAVLFDVGTISRLNPGDILKVTDIFVTHTHIDHFIGFDTVLRTLLRRDEPLRVFGPSNIIDCIEGKLRGYTWNLIREYPLKLDVLGIDGNTLRRAGFYAQNSFERVDMGSIPFSGTALKEAAFKVDAVTLRHDIPCMGFSLEENFHINIDKAALSARGLPVGPWLSEFKRAIRDEAHEDMEFAISGKTYRLGELRGIARITRGQKISYIMDASPEEDNLRKIGDLVRDSDTLYCEAYFLEADRDRAVERNHLTARLAGEIARLGKVKNLVVMHFSPKYRTDPAAIEREAMEEFQRGGS